MASIGHIIAGLSIAVVHDHVTTTPSTPPSPMQRLAAATWFSLLGLAPDADVVGFRLGVAYADAWGHRGASHSMAFAVGLGLLLAWPTARVLGRRLLPTTVAVIAALLSHGLLDALTDGGLGAALWWPFSDVRCFAPWQPLPVAPIGRAFVSMRGLRCIVAEVVMLGPLLLATVIATRLHRARQR
jgi:inner membrane protein